MIQEVKLPVYTPEEDAFMSGWEAASKLLGDMITKKAPDLIDWYDEWESYIEYDNCMDALSKWQEKNKEYGKENI